MKFVHPVDNKPEYCSNNTLGFYPVGRMNTWHGGIHIEAEKPVCAITDGTIVAFRITRKYLTETIGGKTYEYSNCFILIEHQYESPKGNKLVFYSLYNHLKCYEDMIKSKVYPEIFIKTSYKANSDAREMPDASMDQEKIRDIPKGTILDVKPANNNWGKVVRTTDETSGYIYMSRFDPVKIWRLNDSNLDQVVNCNMPIKAGVVIGHTGVYGVEKLEQYKAVHVEVFAADNVEDFLNNAKKDGEKQQHYLKALDGAQLKKAFPGEIKADDLIQITEISDNYYRIRASRLVRTVERSQLINPTKNEPAEGVEFRDYKYNPKTDSLSELSTLFGVPLKKDSLLYLEESSQVPSEQTTRKVSYLTDNGQPQYWVPAAPLKNFRNSKGHLRVKVGFTELYEQQPVKNQPKETSLKGNIIFEINNLRKHIGADDKLWYYLSHKNNKGGTEEGWIKEDDAKLKKISAYDWAEFGFQIIDDSANDHIYDCKSPSKFLSQICNEIDSNKNGVLSQLELQRALKSYSTSYKLSRLVVKHVNEWAFNSAAISKLKRQLDKNFTIEINKEKDPVKKQKYTDLKNVRLDAMQARLKNLCFWQEIKTSNNSFSLKALGGYILKNPDTIGVAIASYVTYQFGKWKTSSKPEEKEEPKIDLVPFPTGSPSVFHFHPTAFVEQMRKLGGCFCNRNFTVDELKEIIILLRKSESIVWQTHGEKLFNKKNHSLPEKDKSFDVLTKEINDAFNKYNINTCYSKIHFIAQVYWESGYFSTTKEGGTNLRYDPYRGRGLMQLTWEDTYKEYAIYSKTKCDTNPDLISDNLHNAVDSAAWFWSEYKKANYTSSQNKTKYAEIQNKSLNEISNYRDKYLDNICKLVNGGVNGLENRINYYNELTKYLKILNYCNDDK